MDPDPLSWLVLIGATGMVVFVAAAEVSVANLNLHELRRLHGGETQRLARLERLLSVPAPLLSSLIVLKTLSFVLIGFAVFDNWRGTENFLSLVGLVLIVWLSLTLVQVVTRAVLLSKSEAFAYRFSGILVVLVGILSPLTSVCDVVARWLVPDSNVLTTDDSILLSEDGLRLLMNVRQEEDAIEETERQMIASILDLEGTLAREAMVPRIDLVALDVETDIHTALAVIVQAGHSRIPVYEENVDRIIGFLYAKDLLPCIGDRQFDQPIRDLLRAPFFVPATRRINELFADMQKQRTHVAIVVDEYGGTAGLITIEDILEEIVGEIQDEYDSEEDEYVQAIGDDGFILNARLDVDTLAETLMIELPDDHADTLGGLLYGLLGRVPEQGESVQYGGWLFAVISVDGRRIEKVRVEVAAFPPVATQQTKKSENGTASGARSLPRFLSL